MGRLLFILNKSLQGFAHPFSLSLKCVVSFSLPEHLGTPSASLSTSLAPLLRLSPHHHRRISQRILKIIFTILVLYTNILKK